MSLTYGFCLDDLSSTYNSAQFSDAFNAVFGEGITQSGAKLAVSINGFTLTAAKGYALVAGRWVNNDEPFALAVEAPLNTRDRTDALVARVDYEARKATLEIVQDVKLEKLPDILRNGNEYSIVLSLIRVKRGVTTITPEDVTDTRSDFDLCGEIVPLSDITGKALYVYKFTLSGIDEAVDKITAQIQALIDKADVEIDNLDDQIKKAGSGASVGDLQTARQGPGFGWLLCDGNDVPDEYPELSELLDGTLPDISKLDDRYRTYIFGGAPVEV